MLNTRYLKAKKTTGAHPRISLARKEAPAPLYTLKDVIDYLGIWGIYTIFLSVLPLLIKIIAYAVLSKDFILAESIAEILFLSILLSSDSIRVLKFSRNKSTINSVLYFLDVPCVIISMILYGFFSFLQYANYQITGLDPKILLIALGAAALFFDLSAQIVYIVEGNLSTSISSKSSDPEQKKVIVIEKPAATQRKTEAAKQKAPNAESEKKAENP